MERKTREKRKEKKRVEEISQDERKKIREEEKWIEMGWPELRKRISLPLAT